MWRVLIGGQNKIPPPELREEHKRQKGYMSHRGWQSPGEKGSFRITWTKHMWAHRDWSIKHWADMTLHHATSVSSLVIGLAFLMIFLTFRMRGSLIQRNWSRGEGQVKGTGSRRGRENYNQDALHEVRIYFQYKENVVHEGERRKDNISHLNESISYESRREETCAGKLKKKCWWWKWEDSREEGCQNLYLIMPVWRPVICMQFYK